MEKDSFPPVSIRQLGEEKLYLNEPGKSQWPQRPTESSDNDSKVMKLKCPSPTTLMIGLIIGMAAMGVIDNCSRISQNNQQINDVQP